MATKEAFEVVAEKEGVLSKKSPSGIRGFRHWQKRWFVFGRKTKESEKTFLRYYKSEEDKKLIATIPVARIVRVQLLPGKRTGCRFDIKMDNSRVYALDATSKKDAKAWVDTLLAAMAARDRKVATGTTTAVAGDSMKWTKFQEFFFKLKYGEIKEGKKATDPESKKKETAMKEMADRFSSNSAILQFILEHVLDPLDVIAEVVVADEKKAEGAPATPASPTAAAAPAKAAPASPSSSSSSTAPASPTASSEKKVNMLHQMKLRKEGNIELAESVRKPDFIRNLLQLFAKKDAAAHNLALRCLWIILHNNFPPTEAAKQFAENVQIFCSEAKFNAQIKNGLFALLFQSNEEVVKDADRVQTVAFYKPFVHPAALKSLFFALKGADFDLRRAALEDLNTTLIGSAANCNSLMEGKQWQEWVWSLLTDIPKDKEEEKAKKVYGYAMNVFAVVHFQGYTTDGSFFPGVCDTMDSLYQYGGPSHQTYEVGKVVLLSLVNKLKSTKKIFNGDDHSTCVWTNFNQLLLLITKFVFQTAHWRSEIARREPEAGAAPADEKKTEAKSTTQTFILSKARIGSGAVVVPFNDSQEFGVHFTETAGKAGDVKLLQTLLSFFDMLHLDKFDADASSNLPKEDIAYMRKAAEDYAFIVDSVSLLELLNRSAIDEGKLTWRKVANVAQRHVAAFAKPGERKSIRDEVENIVRAAKGKYKEVEGKAADPMSPRAQLSRTATARAGEMSPTAEGKTESKEGTRGSVSRASSTRGAGEEGKGETRGSAIAAKKGAAAAAAAAPALVETAEEED